MIINSYSDILYYISIWKLCLEINSLLFGSYRGVKIYNVGQRILYDMCMSYMIVAYRLCDEFDVSVSFQRTIDNITFDVKHESWLYNPTAEL